MNWQILRVPVTVLLAIVLPFLALYIATPESRQSLGLMISPFGKSRLLFFHLALAVPISLAIARVLPQWGSLGSRLLFAVLALLFTVFFTPALAEQLTSVSSLAVRISLSVLLTFPWCYLFSVSGTVKPTEWLAAGLIGIAPMHVYSQRLEETTAKDFETSASAGQLTKTLACLEFLLDLGSDKKFNGKSAKELRTFLQRDIDRLNKMVSAELAPSANRQVKLHRTTQYLQLNRLADAEQLLQTMPQDDLTVRMLTSAVLREQSRWAEFIPVAEQLTKDLPQDPTMYENLGEAYQKLNRSDEALEVYRRAEEAIPKKAGAFQLKQGLVCADRGQSERAKAHFDKAVALDPSLAAAVDGPMRRLKSETFSCLSR